MPSQKEKALLLTKRVMTEGISDKLLSELGEVVGAAQNNPPLGEADGSINEEEWTKLSRFMHNAVLLFNIYKQIERI